jgi:hypothetical protein
LLVVVAIIALLISILLPSLNRARSQAKAVVCASNMASVGKAVASYLAENRAVYPVSYAYITEEDSAEWDINLQATYENARFGYLHWSWFLYSGGQVDSKAFECPEIREGGHPRTNPGEEGYMQPGQVGSAGSPRAVEDKQADKMALTANAAVMPRNKLGRGYEQTLTRTNRFVNESNTVAKRRIVLATEFTKHWENIAVGEGSNLESKSHRPVMVFDHPSASGNLWEYQVSPNRDQLWALGSLQDRETYGIPEGQPDESQIGLIDGANQWDAIGRHHPNETTNFLYTDGGVDRTKLIETFEQHEWGEKYYGLEGQPTIKIGI